MNSSNDEQFLGKIGLSVSGIDRGFPFKYIGWERGLIELGDAQSTSGPRCRNDPGGHWY